MSTPSGQRPFPIPLVSAMGPGSQIEDEELEQVWAGKKTAKEGLDAIVKRGDELLERFQKANSKK